MKRIKFLLHHFSIHELDSVAQKEKIDRNARSLVQKNEIREVNLHLFNHKKLLRHADHSIISCCFCIYSAVSMM